MSPEPPGENPGDSGPGTGVVPMVDTLELAVLADRVLQIAGEDEVRLAEVLDTLDPDDRAALLDSDLLNAFQIFYYHFRTIPDPLAQDRLLLHAAQDAREGILVDGNEDLDVYFLVRDGTPVMEVREADEILASFEGTDAYRRARTYLLGLGH
ncbi:MAG: hypothetical protein LUO99_03890 [Methanomicrobiales archaeon]|nr:hypothetical protein [Methanomicrobiales archaeon]